MFNLEKMNEVVAALKAMPEVTKDEAIAAFMQIAIKHDSGCPCLTQILSEIVGYAIAAEDVEMTRRFVIWQLRNGPVTTPE